MLFGNKTPQAAVNPGETATRVLVIKLSALGDFVLAMGAMKAIRKHHPSAHITLLTTPPFEAFAKASPYFNAVETDGRPADLKGTRNLLKRIRKADYEIIYDLQTSGRTANYFKALNLPGRQTPLWSGHAPGSAFYHDNPERGALHSIDRLAEQLTIAGIGPPSGWTTETQPMPDLSWIRGKLGNPPRLRPEFFGLTKPYMLLIPGASAHRDAKRWPEERYGELATRIADAGVQPVIIGGTAEGKIAHAIARAEPRVKNIVTRTDFFQICSLAEEAAFVVGNDTGPMHMATLSGAPGVALFATNESDPAKAAPRGSNVVIVQAPVLEQVSTMDVWRASQALGRLPSREG
ncbi:MAG: glycosyltransferase family 9 protein [Pseudomonadota bacterium]